MHSEWSDLLLVDRNPQPSTSNNNNNNNNNNGIQVQNTPIKKMMKNIVLVPYKPKLKSWGSWHVKSPNTTSAIDNPTENSELNTVTTEYVPRSPYYSLVHSPQFYENE